VAAKLNIGHRINHFRRKWTGPKEAVERVTIPANEIVRECENYQMRYKERAPEAKVSFGKLDPLLGKTSPVRRNVASWKKNKCNDQALTTQP